MGFHLAWFAAVVREESVDVLELAEEGHQTRLGKCGLVPLIPALGVLLRPRTTLEQV